MANRCNMKHPIGYTREHARVVWKTPVVDTEVRSLDRILPILFIFALGGSLASSLLVPLFLL